MKFVNTSFKNGLAAAALVVLCSAQVSWAGYSYTLVTNWGTVTATLGSPTTGSYTNVAKTGNMTTPSAGVTGSGTYSVKTNQPSYVSTSNTSIVQVLNIYGWKAVPHSYCTSGATADSSTDLSDKLTQDGFVLTPSSCGAGYGIASGEEIINLQRYVVVLGNATAGTAVWFRGYVFDGTVTSRDDIIAGGTKLYDIVITGPFDFGDINSPDRCNALKILIAYTGPNLYLLSDGTALSTTDLKFVSCPSGTINLDPCNPSYSNLLKTSGGCGAVTISYDPPSVPPGSSGVTVTATATDASGNSDTCTFTVSRPLFVLSGCADINAPCGTAVTYPSLTPSGGCPPYNITFNPAASAVGPGTTLVTATATDSKGNVASCTFKVTRPLLTFDGFDSPIGTVGGSCTAPAVTITAGSKIPVKFDTLLCGSAYKQPTPPTVTISKVVNFTTCATNSIGIDNQFLQWVANAWHFNWNTPKPDTNVYRIDVHLIDGSNPFVYIKLQ
ncbi:MAG TPA: hypothetical protein VL361_11365 [Candidatus Limnocylindrales bacterium]|jgi:hypothetical protein|nr:hypothetical protein [Candidatus Limnocylindrales bacterium]